MARILLIQPPVRDFYATHMRTYPLGLMYVASEPLAAGHTVRLLDCMACGKKRTLEVPGKFRHLSRYYVPGDTTPYRLFGHYSHYGFDWKEIGRCAVDFRPDIVGISSLFTTYHSMAVKTAETVREALPDVPVLMGGGHVSVCDAGTSAVTKAVKGGGETAILDYLGETVRFAPGGPARACINPEDYRIGKKRMAFVLTSRGCPNSCSFCSVHGVFKGYGPINAMEVMSDMRFCLERQGVTHFDFEDDAFGYDREQSMSLLEGVIGWGRKDIALSAMNGLCADVLDKEMLSVMRRAGFGELNLSLVSANPSLCRALGRPFEPDLFERCVRTALEMGFSVTAFIILGIPGDTLQSMVESVFYLHELGVKIGPSLFYPVPGTPLYRVCIKDGLLPSSPDYDTLRLTAAPVETAFFNRDDLMTLFRFCRLLNVPHDNTDVLEAVKTRKMVHRFRDGRKIPVSGGKLLEKELLGRLIDRRSPEAPGLLCRKLV